MADAQEISGYVSTATGLCLNFSDFSPSWVLLQATIFLVSAGLAVFDTYTDWEVVLTFREVGFNNPLLPPNVHWLRAWFLFASIGTILTVASIFQDGIGLLYTTYQSCKRHCMRDFTSEESNKEKDAKKDSDDDIDDPCICCYRCGCNVATRNETLGAVTLWFQDVPMLTIAVLYAFSQSTCKVPDTRDVTPVLRDIGISALAATLAATWRLARSFVRLYTSIGTRIEGKKGCITKCLPKKGEAVYPPGSCTQYCIFAFYFGLLMQIPAVLLGGVITASIWANFLLLQTPNFDDSLAIYRFSLNPPDVRLFDISGTIIPSNGSFVNLEQIPSRELELDQDIVCLSEFEYRSEEFRIFVNVIQLYVVSEDGQFCTSAEGTGPDCTAFYTFRNFILYYGSVDPNSGEVERFDDECIVVRDIFNYRAGPVFDSSIDVTRHINRTGLPQNGEPLIVFYPEPTNLGIEVSLILSADDYTYSFLHTFQELMNSSANATCVVRLAYDFLHSRVNFNYRDVYNLESGCECSSIFTPGPECRRFHEDLTYAYVSQDGQRGVPLTQCSTIPREKLVPYHDPTIRINVDCSLLC